MSKLVRFVKDKKFEYTIIVFIIISSVYLALDNPLLDPKGKFKRAILIIDYFVSGIFIIEVILKVKAFGLLLNGPNSYFRD